MEVLGIDIGGTGIKGAPVDTASGRLLRERFRLETPKGATPNGVAKTVAAIADHFGWKGPIGCGLPAVVRQHTVRTAANISKRWIGVSAYDLLKRATKCDVTVINDADAAGYAEMHFGAGRRRAGVIVLITLGTGIGTAIFVNGHLVPNTELGHIEIEGVEAEQWAAESVRERDGLSWKKWAKRLDAYCRALERYLWPDLFIVGGGVSKKSEKFLPRLHLRTPVVPAKLLNDAGIVGAALAYEHERRRSRQKLALD
jgi:polyphosphate glucokinase